jgi:hypothetical protein
LALNPPGTKQPEVGLIRDGGGFQRLGRLPGEVLSGYLPDLGVNHGHEIIEGLRVALAPGGEEPGYVFWRSSIHASSKVYQEKQERVTVFEPGSHL